MRYGRSPETGVGIDGAPLPFRVALSSDTRASAQRADAKLRARYRFCSEDEAELILVVGGDGFMLNTVRRFLNRKPIPKFFGLNLGRRGFLLNAFQIGNLGKRLAEAKPVVLTPLKVVAVGLDDRRLVDNAVNEISLLRHSPHTAALSISVDGVRHLNELRADGCLLSTAAGSTGYNVSAHGPILPLTSNLMALTPICPFEPRRWRGAVLPGGSSVEWKVKNYKIRPVVLACDNHEIGRIKSAKAKLDTGKKLRLLFDQNSNLDEKNIRTQFSG